MANGFSRALREKIVAEFAGRHRGRYNPATFVEEVRAKGQSHPAYDWFEWDTAKASHEYLLWQARTFVSDLRIVVMTETVGRSGIVKIKETSMPMLISPVDGRQGGGGYFYMAPDDPDKMAEFCAQAATALSSWLNRYRAALDHAGGSAAGIEKQITALEAMAPVEMEPAEQVAEVRHGKVRSGEFGTGMARQAGRGLLR